MSVYDSSYYYYYYYTMNQYVCLLTRIFLQILAIPGCLSAHPCIIQLFFSPWTLAMKRTVLPTSVAFKFLGTQQALRGPEAFHVQFQRENSQWKCEAEMLIPPSLPHTHLKLSIIWVMGNTAFSLLYVMKMTSPGLML